MKPYRLKLQDTPVKRDGKFAEKPLWFSEWIGIDNDFWEYIPSLAMEFETSKEVLAAAIRNQALNPFHAKDRLFIFNVDTEEEIEINRTKLGNAALKLKAQLQAERNEQRKQEDRERRKQESRENRQAKLAKKLKSLIPDVAAVTIALAPEVVESAPEVVESATGLTNTDKPDILEI